MKKINLYDGEHPLFFDSTSHTYYDSDRKLVPNATSVNDMLSKPALVQYAANKAADHVIEWLDSDDADPLEIGDLFDQLEQSREAHKRYSKERALLGSGVHKYIDKCLRYELGQRKDMPPMPDHELMRNSIRAYMKYRQRNPMLGIIHSERIVYHPEKRHCGTADVIACHPGARYVIGDWKTGSMISVEAALQGASYCKAAEREFGHEFERELVHINVATGHLSVWTEDRIQDKLTKRTVDEDYEQFLRNLATYLWYRGTRDGWRMGRS